MMENQPAYGQEDEIDLVALTFTLLRKYRQILAAALACAIIFGAAAGAHTAWGGAVSQDAQKAYESELAEYNRKKESYEAAKQQYSLDIANNEKSQRDTEYAIQKAQEYAENSVWNNLDPYNVRVAQADLYVTTNYQIQPGMAYQNPHRFCPFGLRFPAGKQFYPERGGSAVQHAGALPAGAGDHFF